MRRRPTSVDKVAHLPVADRAALFGETGVGRGVADTIIEKVLGLLELLAVTPAATDEEALTFIERHRLMGRGIGFIDVHLLTSTALAEDARL